KVNQRVAIQIRPQAAGPPTRIADSGDGRYVGIGAIAVVLQQQIRAVSTDKKVTEAIGIKITGRAPLTEQADRGMTFLSDFDEGTSHHVSIEAAVMGLIRSIADDAPIDQEQIQPTVAVEIHPGNSRPHDLGKEVSAGHFVVECLKTNPR